MPRLLSSPLELHDVRDVEALARRVLRERLGAWRARLTASQEEDAVSYLIAVCWELSEGFEPERGLSFSTYAYRMLRRRLVDWYRSTFGDSRHGSRPELLSLEHYARPEDKPASAELVHATYADVLADESAADELEALLEALSVGVDFSKLSEDATETLEQIARPLAGGASLEALARSLGKSRRFVNGKLEELRLEVAVQRPDLWKEAA